MLEMWVGGDISDQEAERAALWGRTRSLGWCPLPGDSVHGCGVSVVMTVPHTHTCVTTVSLQSLADSEVLRGTCPAAGLRGGTATMGNSTRSRR